MQRVPTTALLALTVLLFAGLALAGGERCRKESEAAHTATAETRCEKSADACLSRMAAKIRAEGWSGIETEKNVAGRYEVVAVESGSPAEAAGFRTGDVLLAVDRLDLYAADEEELHDVERRLTVGSQVRYTVATSGQKRELDVTLAEVPARIMAQWIGQHMLDQHAPVDAASR
ncbi:MAG: PDZ domain-containing protein [Thermoanaerobaculia bacterium]|nr:PDZ domain-containing protein [Thermoanaerobaculia bacterium]